MITIFAEKPDVARKIAAAIGPVVLDNGTKVTYKDVNKYEKELKTIQFKHHGIPIKFKGEECIVTHGYGHLCGLWELRDYDEAFEKWSDIDLPYIPEKYKVKVTPDTKDHFKAVADYFNKSTYIINATDWDREGEVIFSYVYECAKCKKPYKRAYYNSQTEEAFIESFDNLHDSSEVKNLEQAGRCRGIADWLIGMNMTVAATLKARYGSGFFPIGRVQTPTLNMVVEREKAVSNFSAKKYYMVSGEFTTDKGETYTGEYKEKFENIKDVDNFISSLSVKCSVKSIEQKTESLNSPSLYNLSLLQMDANSKFGLTADETLKIVQRLYEAGVTTYPRTSSAFLPEDYMPQATRALNSIESLPEYTNLLKGKPRNFNKKYFNDKKVESHFAIVPTHVVPKSFKEKEDKMVYDLICKSLIMTIYPNAEKELLKVVTVSGDKEFTSSGSRISKKGWMEVVGVPNDKLLPELKKNESVNGNFTRLDKTTEPPKRYTDKTLIAAMMSADKNADEKDIMSLAELNIAGIGQESTRASIIETLVNRQYIKRVKKSFYATEKGIALIDGLPVEDIKSASLTAEWETKLNKVSKGEISAEEFVAGIESLTKKWCKEIDTMKFSSIKKEENESGLKCPKCGKSVRKYDWGYGCTGYKEGCKFSINNKIAGKKLTDKQIESLLTKGSTGKIQGFVSKAGKKFEAKLSMDSEGKITFVFEK